jgi:2'-5' RNA ligase
MLRTFLAIDLTDDVRRAIVRAQGELKKLAGRGVSWVRPENMHITLKFLGEVDEARLPEVVDATCDAVGGAIPFEVDVQGLGTFGRRQPKVIWAGVLDPDGRMTDVFRAVEAALAPLGFAADTRRYLPHVTLGRVRRGAVRSLVDRIERERETAFGPVPVESVTVYTSRLTKTGPIYSIAGHAPLG